MYSFSLVSLASLIIFLHPSPTDSDKFDHYQGNIYGDEVHTVCFGNYFVCRDGLHVCTQSKCNDFFDCLDWSDESSCGLMHSYSDPKWFRCDNNLYIPRWQVDNLVDDCGDGSDEPLSDLQCATDSLGEHSYDGQKERLIYSRAVVNATLVETLQGRCNKDSIKIDGIRVKVEDGCTGIFNICSLPGRIETLRCNSDGNKYRLCEYPNRIYAISIKEKHSRTSCTYGSNFKFHFNAKYMQVDGGCQATFYVGVANPVSKGNLDGIVG